MNHAFYIGLWGESELPLVLVPSLGCCFVDMQGGVAFTRPYEPKGLLSLGSCNAGAGWRDHLVSCDYQEFSPRRSYDCEEIEKPVGPPHFAVTMGFRLLSSILGRGGGGVGSCISS